MAITTYAELQTAIASFAARSDLTTVIPDFITLAETMFNNGDDEVGFPPLRVREMETTTTDTPSSGSLTLDTDFLEMKRVTYQSDPKRRLEYASADWLDEAYPTTNVTDASFYTIIGTSLVIRPAGTADVEYVYYEKIPALSVSNTSNWLLAKSPNAYLYGALYHLNIYAMSPDAAVAMLALAKRACGALTGADKLSRAGSYVMRAAVPAQ